jgi:hypothetical protein
VYVCVFFSRKSVLELQRSVFLFAKVSQLNLNKYIPPWYNFLSGNKSHIPRNKTKMRLYVTHNKTRVSILLTVRPEVALNPAVTAQIDFSDSGILNHARIISSLVFLSASFEEYKINGFSTIQHFIRYVCCIVCTRIFVTNFNPSFSSSKMLNAFKVIKP